MSDRLEIVCSEGAVRPSTAWAAFVELFEAHGAAMLEVYGEEPLPLNEIGAYLNTMKERSVIIGGEGCHFIAASHANHQLTMINVAFRDDLTAQEWEQASAGLRSSKDMITWRIYDHDYERWQCAEQIQDFQFAGRPYEHLPTRPSNLPTPLPQIVIDISSNPGRRVFRDGCIEAVGSVMWLGPLFRERTGGDYNELRKYPWAKIEERDGLVRIESYPHAFDSDQGEQREIQEALRATLFPRSYLLPVDA